MIKKLRNQPYAPKVGASSQMGPKRKKKKTFLQLSYVKIFSFALKYSLPLQTHTLTDFTLNTAHLFSD
jgi:hypothetical protein